MRVLRYAPIGVHVRQLATHDHLFDELRQALLVEQLLLLTVVRGPAAVSSATTATSVGNLHRVCLERAGNRLRVKQYLEWRPHL